MCRSRSKGRGGAGSLCQAHAIEISSGIWRRRTQAISPPGNDDECPAARLKPYMLTAAWQVDIGFDNFPVAQGPERSLWWEGSRVRRDLSFPHLEARQPRRHEMRRP